MGIVEFFKRRLRRSKHQTHVRKAKRIRSGRIAVAISNPAGSKLLKRFAARAPHTYKLFWSPEGKCIATVQARDMKAAIRKAPQPYRKYLGEIYAELHHGAECECIVCAAERARVARPEGILGAT